MIRSCPSTLAAILFCVACGAPPSGSPMIDSGSTDGGAVRFKHGEISAESSTCPESDTRCARVEVRTIETIGGGTESVRENIDLFVSHDLVSRMRRFLPEDVGNRIAGPEGLAAAFLAQQRAFVDDFPETPARWILEIEAAPVYNTPDVATIDIRESAYTGGAHPNSRRRLVSFEVKTGQLLGVEDLTADIERLAAMVEAQLRADRDLGHEDDLEAAGFWFPQEGFSLPDNFGITAEGLVFHWDAYEIAPYSMGPIDVTVPTEELASIIDQRFVVR